MKTMKRLGCLLLVLAMVLALGVTAMAAPQTLASSPSTTGSITINGAIANETYTIYQIFDLTYTDDLATDDEGGTISGSASSYSYKVCEGWSDFLKSYTVNVDGINTALFTLTGYGYVDPSSLIFTYGEEDSKVSDEVIADFARAALAYAEESNEITGTSVKYTYDAATGTATLDPQDTSISISNVATDENGYVTGDLTFSSLSLGYYLVDTSLGTLCMLNSTDPDAVINEKNGEPTIKKYVHENSADDDDFGPEDDAYNGDLIKFEIEVDDIAGAVNLVVHDAMDEELSIPNEEDFDINATLYTSTGDEGRTVTLTKATWDEITETWGGGDYYITTGTCSADACSFGTGTEYGVCDFEIHFIREFNDVDSTGYIEFTYELLLDTENDEYYDDYEEIDNWAQVTFGNASASLVVEAETFTFGFEVWKYTGDMSVVWTSIADPAGTVDVYLCYTMGEDENLVRYFAIIEESEAEGYGESVDNAFNVIGWTTDMEEAWYVEYSGSTGTTQDSQFHGDTFYFTGMIGTDNCHLYAGTYIAGTWRAMDEEDLELYDGENSNPAVALAGASFQVTNSSDQVAYFKTEELGDKTIYLFEGWLREDEDLPEGDYTTTLTTASDGLLNIEGLDAGTYTLTEIAAPDGYNLLDDSITVKIEAEYDETTGAMISHTVTYYYGDAEQPAGTGVVYVQNNAGSILPGTGGIGTTIFYVVGAILVCGAVVLLVTKRRTSNKKQAEA